MIVRKKVPICGQCGTELGENYYYSSKTQWHRYGSPLQECPACGRISRNYRYIEIELQGIRFEDKIGFSPLSLIHAIIHGGVGSLLLKNDCREGLVFIGVAIMLIVIELHGCKKHRKMLMEEALLSKKRMSDPIYAKKLQMIGYRVPEHYLNGYEKAMEDAKGKAEQERAQRMHWERIDNIK